MSSLSAINHFTTAMTQTMQANTKQVMQEAQQGMERLDRKKANAAEAGLQRLKDANEVAAKQADVRRKIDVYA